MDKVKRSLEDRLDAMRGPAMPPDVETRIRQRLLAASAAPARKPDRPALCGIISYPMMNLVMTSAPLDRIWLPL